MWLILQSLTEGKSRQKKLEVIHITSTVKNPERMITSMLTRVQPLSVITCMLTCVQPPECDHIHAHSCSVPQV